MEIGKYEILGRNYALYIIYLGYVEEGTIID